MIGAEPLARVAAARALSLAAALLAVAPLSAQVPAGKRMPSTDTTSSPRPLLRPPADSTSVRRPSDNPDDRYLEAQKKIGVVLPVMPRLAEGAPEPAFARTVFDRDSIEWVNAETVGDLLARIPGVFLWRGGRRGRPEMANYLAHGATAVQYVLDGMPYVPAGPDSVSVDPGLFALSFLDRVEVERWPGRLEVRLYTRRHDRLAPRSRIAVAAGSDRLALYADQRFAPGTSTNRRRRLRTGARRLADDRRREHVAAVGAGQLCPVEPLRHPVPADPHVGGS